MPRVIDLAECLARRPAHGESAWPRLLAMVLTMAVRDGSPLVVLEPDGSEACRLWYMIDGTRYDMVPPPPAGGRKLGRLLREWVRPGSASEAFFFGPLSVRVGSTESEVLVVIRETDAGPRIALHLPSDLAHLTPPSGETAAAVDDRLTVEFTDADLRDD